MQNIKGRIITVIVLILFIYALSKTGIDRGYNYYTAQLCKYKDEAKIIKYLENDDVPHRIGWHQYYLLMRKHDLIIIYVKRENYNKSEQRGIEKFNKQMELYLNKKHGKDWLERFNKDVDSILRLNCPD